MRRILGAGVAVALCLSAWGLTASATTADGGTPTRQEPTAIPIVVFFSRHPESDEDFTKVFPVARTAPDLGVARAALRHLIAGPTPEEQAAGYFSELGEMLRGPSSCGGRDFTIALANGVATVQFCRLVSSAGVGQDARAHLAIDATLGQFPTIQRIRLLTSDGHCLFDQSGLDLCLRP